MGTMAVRVKLMPTSPDVALEEIKDRVGKITNCPTKFEEEPIAFGLKAIIASFGWSEDKELDSLEEELGKIENVNSVEIIDIRRAFG